jgi:ABC-type long-subunit fatty acid transport system fused permease/ATPase subunit
MHSGGKLTTGMVESQNELIDQVREPLPFIMTVWPNSVEIAE